MTSVEAGSPRWAPDPTRRFAQRYWDGAGWTDFVAGLAGGAASVDPLAAHERRATDRATPGTEAAEPVPAIRDGVRRPAIDDGLTWSASRSSMPGTTGLASAADSPVDASWSPETEALPVPGWARDPTGRHVQRYWDGSRWTDAVAGVGGGMPARDPLRWGEDRLPGPGAGERWSPRATAAVRPVAATGASSATAAAAAFDATPEADAVSGPTRSLVEPPRPQDEREDGRLPPAGWARDPTGRHRQRYWDGTGWTDFVAGAAGGAASLDRLRAHERGPAADGNGSADPAAGSSSAGAGAPTSMAAAGVREEPRDRPGPGITDLGVPAAASTGAGSVVDPPGLTDPVARASGRRKTFAVLGLVAAVAAVALVVLSGVLDGGGPPGKAAHPAARRSPAKTAGGVKVSGAVTATTGAGAGAAAAVKPVDPARDPCGVLSPTDIKQATGIPVGPGEAVAGGCAWRGPNPIGGAASAQARAALHGQEGVLLYLQPLTRSVHPSVRCTASLPGVAAPGGICTTPTGAQYAMFQARDAVLELFILTSRPTNQDQLIALAQLAYAHSLKG